MPLRPVPAADRLPARVRDVGELAAVVPYLLGFVPHESLTLLALRAGQVALAARLDLVDVCDPVAGDGALAVTTGAIARGGATAVFALLSSADDPPPGLVGRVRSAVLREGLVLVDVGHHRDGRCRSLVCADPGCCPAEGFVVDTACAAAATAAYSGAVALPDRAAVVQELERPAPVDHDALAPLLQGWETRAVRAIVAGHGELHTARRTAAVLTAARAADRAVGLGTAPPQLSDDAVAGLLVALSEITVRDAVWLALDAREVHGEGLWLELAHRAPAPYDASPLFLLGWRSWRRGDGVRALLAARRCVASDPGYSAARLLLDAIARCVDPRAFPRLDGSGPARQGPSPDRR